MINKKIIAKNFSGAAENYDDFALVQKKSAQKLCELSREFIKEQDFILDLGSGTSFIKKNLFPAKICEVDISLNMLKYWNCKTSSNLKINADIEQLPFKNAIFDVVISSFALQWIEDFDKLFAYLQKIIKDEGVIIFSLPTKNSLENIKKANKNSNCNFNIKTLPDALFIKEKLLQNNFREILFFEEKIEQNASAFDFLKNIKKIGANYSVQKNFIGKENLKKFNDFFLEKFNNRDCWHVNYFIYKKYV